MIRRLAVLLAAFALALGPATGQQAAAGAEAPAAPVPAVEDLTPSPYLKGERILSLTGGLQLPLLITPKDATAEPGMTLKLGGSFSFTWQEFVSTGLALGGSLAGSWNGTVGGRTLFSVPLSFRAAYWAAALPFEFYGAAELGAYLMRFDGKGMIGPFAKLGGGALWQFPSGWSLGLQAFSWFVPEIHTGAYAELTRTGIFLETGLVAAFHL